ncbi:MAG: right-handed parallel beta-helix repeat-containing protein [Verrucomicrobia bacterium]|nr:right-handed parallel beta-helix repeat-containing protein [Deltaproteobacteria bacterium]
MPGSFRFGLFITLWMLCLCPAVTASAATAPLSSRPAINQIPTTYENATITEDVSWRGSVVIKGALVVAAQATLRIEPGTVIRFMTVSSSRQLPRLVVMGRIQSIGTLDRPILFTAGSATLVKGGAWGGLLLLSSEKRNQLEHCRIEGAETGLEGRFSIVTAKALSITRSTNGCILRDSTASLASSNINDCDTGLEAHDSEVELRDATLAANRRGMSLFRSSVVMSSVVVTGSTELAILSDDCRLKFTACEISDNAGGARVTGGEGQIFLSSFVRNRETALHLASARLKISRCRISDNLRDGLRLEDDRATIWGNAISDNGGYNLVSAGRDTVNAVQNWWGSSVESVIAAKLSAAATVQRSAAVNVFPWLSEKPAIFP